MLCAIALALSVSAAELSLPTLRTKQGSYTNVVVTGKTGMDLFIRHDGGLANVKLADIQDDAALVALGLKSAPPKVVETPAVSTPVPSTSAPPSGVMAAVRNPEAGLAALREVKKLLPNGNILAMMIGVLFALYLFACYCLKLICEKAGHPPGALVWIPLLQMIPAFRAAQMSGWWVLALFVPLLNIVAQIMWCFKITAARGKSVGVAILLLVPGLNLFALLYLAFSDAGE